MRAAMRKSVSHRSSRSTPWVCVGVIATLVWSVMPAHAQVAAGTPPAASPGPVANVGALTLPAAEALLAQHNRDIALAQRARAQASADVITAGQRPNPQLSWTTQNINPNRGIGNGDPRAKTVDSIVRVDQLIERGNKAELRTETARRLEGAAGEDVQEVTRQQLLALRFAYFDLLAAQEKAASAAETAQLFGKTAEAAQLRLKAGDLAAADVSRIRVDVLRAQNDARGLEADLSRARVNLAYLIGAEANAHSIRAVTSWPQQQGTAAVATVSDERLEARPDVRAARARVAAAEKARELAQALRTRDVSVGLQYEHWPNRADFNNQGTGNSFGVAFSVPLFLRHNNEGEIARAQADWYAARDALERTLAQARSDVARASGDLAAARERLTRFEGELVREAERTATAAEFAFKNGAIGVMDLLDARRTLKAIQIDAANARADHAKASAAYTLSTGVVQ